MAAGNPIVAFKTGGVAEIIKDGMSGFLVPLNDVNGMVSRINELISSEKLRVNIGNNAKKRVLEKVLEFLERFLY